jgi:signal transduction histidine kinase
VERFAAPAGQVAARRSLVLSHWPIRKKLIVGIALLLTTVVVLSCSGFLGLYAYRCLAKSISLRATELPLAAELTENVRALRVTLKLAEENAHQPMNYEFSGSQGRISERLLNIEFQTHLGSVKQSFEKYRRQLSVNRESEHYPYIGGRDSEMHAVGQFDRKLAEIEALADESLMLLQDGNFFHLREDLIELGRLSADLPSYLHGRMRNLADEVRGQYRLWIVLTMITSVSATCLIVLSTRLFYAWIFYPLRVLIHGSRQVAKGDFDHRISLESQDEMAELARAMNEMTRRFQEIRDDLDQQVQQRSREVIRGEQLASVGFLAAGVAHEINNPLASIALCAESLETRLRELIGCAAGRDEDLPADEMEVVQTYLKMIQDEAFRCKEITERLLDFSRLGGAEKHPTDLSELVEGVIEMVRHLGKYKQKQIDFQHREPVLATVNQQEIKQVVLNLITNGLDSLEPGGTVTVMLSQTHGVAELTVADDGCGMTEEVLEHVFEPFFTRRRDGQGTGLGTSISYRIVTEHGGSIAAKSDGPGRGSRFTVTLPVCQHDQEALPTRAA